MGEVRYMKTLVVYRSILGTTKQYAQWLSETLYADRIDFHHADERTLAYYDCIIVTSGTYAGKMPLVGFLKKHWEVLKHKKVVVMAVGIAPADTEESKKSYELIPEDIRKKIMYFKVPGNMMGVKPAGEPTQEQLASVISYVRNLQ